MLRVDLVQEQFGEFLKCLTLPENWRELIRRQMVAKVFSTGVISETIGQEKERLKLKTRIIASFANNSIYN